MAEGNFFRHVKKRGIMKGTSFGRPAHSPLRYFGQRHFMLLSTSRLVDSHFAIVLNHLRIMRAWSCTDMINL